MEMYPTELSRLTLPAPPRPPRVNSDSFLSRRGGWGFGSRSLVPCTPRRLGRPLSSVAPAGVQRHEGPCFLCPSQKPSWGEEGVRSGFPCGQRCELTRPGS